MRLFNTFIVRRLVDERVRSGVTVVGIALGIAVVVAIQMANASSVNGFARALEAVSGRTSLEVVGPSGAIDETALRDLGWLRDYGEVSPVVEGDIRARVAAGRSETLKVLGVDVLRDQPIREYLVVDSTEGRRALRADEFLGLLLDERSVVLTERFATRHGLQVGDEIELRFGDRPGLFVIRGLLGDRGPAQALDGNVALMDIAAAQLAFGRLGWLDRVDVRLAPGLAIDDAERTIAERLPAGLSVQRPERRGRQVETMLAAFHFNLTALSYIALLVGLFLVYDTVSVSVIARREEVGTLRALGVRRATVLRLFLAEAAALALAGAALGLPLARLLAYGAVELTSTTVNVLYIAASAEPPPLDLGHVALAFGIGVPLALVAAAVPALEASRVPPIAAMRGADRLELRYRLGKWHLIGPAVLFGAAWGLARLPAVDGLPIFGFGAALATVFGGALLVPASLYGLGRLGAVPLARLFHIEGRLAHANIVIGIPRIAISVAALAVSLAMLVSVAIMIGSFRETVIYWVGQTVQADLYVSAGRSPDPTRPAAISPAVERVVRTHPDVEAVDRFRRVNVPYGNSLVTVASGEFDVLLAHGTLLFKTPADGREAMRGAIGRDAVVISESFAIKHERSVGDEVVLPTVGGSAAFDVAAVYYDYSSDRGLAVMDRKTFVRHFAEAQPTSLSVYLRDGVAAEQVREEMLAGLGDQYRAFVNTSGTLREAVLRVFDSTFAITYALEGIAIFVAIMGIAGTLVTLILERRRELALLRLVGADRRQVRKMVVIEAGLLGIAAQGVGGVVGLALSLILIYVVNVQSFGWTIQFHVPGLFLAQASALIFVATLVAGIYPARRATRLDVAAQVAEE